MPLSISVHLPPNIPIAIFRDEMLAKVSAISADEDEDYASEPVFRIDCRRKRPGNLS